MPITPICDKVHFAEKDNKYYVDMKKEKRSSRKGLTPMWYVIQTKSGEEFKNMNLCKRALKTGSYYDAFVPQYVCMKRYEGAWHYEKKVLFSGYFFIDTNQPDIVEEAILPLSRLMKPVYVGKDFVPIYAEEQSFLEDMMDAEHSIAMSRGNIVEGVCDIQEGPLQKKVSFIRKIDRHKRTAEILLHLFGQERRVKMGLEIISKS